eukprot:scaffold75072_cov51-Attheya_sp.AAC.1
MIAGEWSGEAPARTATCYARLPEEVVERNTPYRYVRGLPAPCTYRYRVLTSKDGHRLPLGPCVVAYDNIMYRMSRAQKIVM